jgi:hypothetical protein
LTPQTPNAVMETQPETDSVEVAGAPDDEAAIAAGIDALNRFDPTDRADGWVTAREIVRALYFAMRPPHLGKSEDDIFPKERRVLFGASALQETPPPLSLMGDFSHEVPGKWGCPWNPSPRFHEQ